MPTADTVLPRLLRVTDPNNTIGVGVVDWAPVIDSEMTGRIVREPTIGRYRMAIHSLNKGTDEAEAQALSDDVAKSIRTLVYSDDALSVSLLGLSEVLTHSTERLKRWGVKGVRFQSGELKGAFTFLSALDLWVDTEVRPT